MLTLCQLSITAITKEINLREEQLMVAMGLEIVAHGHSALMSVGQGVAQHVVEQSCSP